MVRCLPIRCQRCGLVGRNNIANRHILLGNGIHDLLIITVKDRNIGGEPPLAICLPIRLTAKRSARSPQIQHKIDLQNVGCRLHEVHKATSHLRALPASVRNTHIWVLSAFISTIRGGSVVVCVVLSAAVVVVVMVVVSGGIVVCTVVSCTAVDSV